MPILRSFISILLVSLSNSSTIDCPGSIPTSQCFCRDNEEYLSPRRVKCVNAGLGAWEHGIVDCTKLSCFEVPVVLLKQYVSPEIQCMFYCRSK
jgi:hypothetical protein